MSIIDNRYVDTVSLDSITEKAIPLILDELDPHSVYVPAKDMAAMNESLDGEFDGIGVMFNMATDTVIVLNVINAGPSAKAGVLGGDRIIKINDTVVAGVKMSQDEVMKRLRGPRGSQVKLGIQRIGVKELVPITVTRGVIPIHCINAAYMITPEIGYVVFAQFSRTAYRELMNAISLLQSQGMKKLILDLRGNPGGFLDQAIAIANEFLPANRMIVYTEERGGLRQHQFSNGKGKYQDLELAILVDESSASSSEILAGALQDNDCGTIIGRRTFGKGLVQEQIPFSDGSAVRLTIARYYTPSGRSIQKPYDKGREAYNNDLINRFEHNEMFSADSIKFADSLRFTTPGGKVVYGGGGIMPDIRMPENYYSRFTNMLFAKGYIEDFANLYFKKHREPIDVDTFEVTDADYNEFVAFMADKPIDSESDTKQTLDQLRQKAERDKYLDRIEEELNAIEEKIQDDKQTDLEAFKDELKMLLSNEIVMRYHYIGGVVRNNAHHDPEVLKAIEVLRDTTNYHRILTSQDTERK